MSSPIWVTDPAGNNNPNLIIVGTIFLVIESQASGTGNNQVAIHRSTTGFSWTSIALPYFQGPEIQSPSAQDYAYGNGIFGIICTEVHDSGNLNVSLTSSDGRAWTVADSSGQSRNIVFDPANNWIAVRNISNQVVATVPSPLAPNTITTGWINFIDSSGNIHGAGTPPSVPSGITNFDINNPGGQIGVFEVSTNNAASYQSVVSFNNDNSIAITVMAAISK